MPQIIEGYPLSQYAVDEAKFSADEEKLVSAFLDLVFRRISPAQFCSKTGFSDPEVLDSFVNSIDGSRIGKPIEPEIYRSFENNIQTFASQFKVGAKKVARKVSESVYGFKVIQPLFEDEDLEEIMINGANKPVLVYHKDYGLCKTNLSFKNERELSMFIAQISRLRDGESQGCFEDLRLEDKSRANITYPPATAEITVTIRKFRKQPLTVLDLIENGTVSSELAAFLWMAIDGLTLYPLNFLIVGGTASGKTTTLNALSSLVPPNERIITIEDTPELNFSGRENWVAMESNKSLGLDALLKNALRMRPDRLVVGEVRGEEAETLFTSMNVGHRGSLGTLHANSDRDAIKRLENSPMNVPRALIPLVDFIVVQHRVYDRRKGLLRRVMQVSEVSRLEDQVALNEIFKWDPAQDDIYRTQLSSESFEKISKATGLSINAVKAEVEHRKDMLDYLIKNKVRKKEDFERFLSTYYAEINPKKKKPQAVELN